MDELDRFLEVSQQAARKAGELLLRMLGRAKVREKAPADLVTEADVAAQQVICEHILSAFPDHTIVAEEGTGKGRNGGSEAGFSARIGESLGGGGSGQENASNATAAAVSASQEPVYRWHIDPLDGTTNFVHRYPVFAVSVGLERAGQLLVGAVYQPVTDELYWAKAGGGAWLRDQRLQTSDCRDLSSALAALGLPPRVSPESPDFRFFLEVLPHCQSIRRTGCTALNLCYTAAGYLDFCWGLSTHSWDIAAGVLLVLEAGGSVSGPLGEPLSLENGQYFAAANPEILGQVVKLSRRVLG